MEKKKIEKKASLLKSDILQAQAELSRKNEEIELLNLKLYAIKGYELEIK